jgi:hypothetical protein
VKRLVLPQTGNWAGANPYGESVGQFKTIPTFGLLRSWRGIVPADLLSASGFRFQAHSRSTFRHHLHTQGLNKQVSHRLPQMY